MSKPSTSDSGKGGRGGGTKSTEVTKRPGDLRRTPRDGF